VAGASVMGIVLVTRETFPQSSRLALSLSVWKYISISIVWLMFPVLVLPVSVLPVDVPGVCVVRIEQPLSAMMMLTIGNKDDGFI